MKMYIFTVYKNINLNIKYNKKIVCITQNKDKYLCLPLRHLWELKDSPHSRKSMTAFFLRNSSSKP